MVLSITKGYIQLHYPVNSPNFKVSILTLRISTIRLWLKVIILIFSNLINNSHLNRFQKFPINNQLQTKVKTSNFNLKSHLCRLRMKVKKHKAPSQLKQHNQNVKKKKNRTTKRFSKDLHIMWLLLTTFIWKDFMNRALHLETLSIQHTRRDWSSNKQEWQMMNNENKYTFTLR